MIQVDGLSKRFGAIDVLRDVSLSIERGEVLAIIGPSGGGKSTLLRCLIGLEAFDAGRIAFGGQVLHAGMNEVERARAMQSLRGRMGMVFQQFHLFPHLSVLDNVIAAPTYVLGKSRDEAVAQAEALLDRVGVLEKCSSKPHQLSGGQQQRVAIARALAMEPEVILFDEPTSALDPRMTDEVLSVMTDLASAGQSMVVVTHVMPFARKVADHVHVFCDGSIVESGRPEQIFEAPRELMTRTFLNATFEARVAVRR